MNRSGFAACLFAAAVSQAALGAPTLQDEGALASITTGNLVPVPGTHQADDILLVSWIFWGPNSTSLPDVATPSGWVSIAQADAPAADGKVGYYYKRATGSSDSVTFTRPAGWDTGADTNWSGRVYVIRGCITTGDPWDEADMTAIYSTALQPVDALTVSGSGRLAIHFLAKSDDFAVAPTVPGWTAGTQVESTTGTDASAGSFRIDDRGTDTTADVSTVEAPAAGRYAFLGVSFKPPDPTATSTWTPTFTWTPTWTPTATPTFTPAESNTFTVSDTSTHTPTSTWTPTATPTATPTFTPTPTWTPTITWTFTATPCGECPACWF